MGRSGHEAQAWPIRTRHRAQERWFGFISTSVRGLDLKVPQMQHNVATATRPKRASVGGAQNCRESGTERIWGKRNTLGVVETRLEHSACKKMQKSGKTKK